MRRHDLLSSYGVNWLIKRFDLDEFLATVAIVGFLAHVIGLYIYVTFFTEHAFFSWSYPLRILDPFWWILAWMGGFISMKSGMFNCARYGGTILAGILIVLMSIIPTVLNGLAFGIYMLGGGYALIGLCIVLNKHRPEKPS